MTFPISRLNSNRKTKWSVYRDGEMRTLYWKDTWMWTETTKAWRSVHMLTWLLPCSEQWRYVDWTCSNVEIHICFDLLTSHLHVSTAQHYSFRIQQACYYAKNNKEIIRWQYPGSFTTYITKYGTLSYNLKILGITVASFCQTNDWLDEQIN